MSLNPKIPITRASDASIIGTARGLRLNTANANTWVVAQTFSSTVTLQSNTFNYAQFYNESTMYNNGTFYSFGTMNVPGAFVSTGTFNAAGVDISTRLRVRPDGGLPFYEYPYAGSYTLANPPVLPASISGTTSFGGFLYDDGLGNLLDSYYGHIATIDYATGIVTDDTYGYVSTNYINYTQSSASYCELLPTGQATVGWLDVKGSIQCDTIANDTGLASGTYTPTLTGVTNVASSTAYPCQYMRVGNTVTVSGLVELTPTANNTQTTIRISLPISSAFVNNYELGGTAHTIGNTTAGHGASIEADATNDEALMDYYETHGVSDTFTFTFTYQVI